MVPWKAVALTYVLLVASGCTAPESETLDQEVEPVEESIDPWSNATRVPVAERIVSEGSIQEFDFLCVFGGTDFYDLPRTGRVLDGATALVFTVASGHMTTATQAGYAMDGGPIQWLPAVANGQEVFEIPLGLDETEDAGTRWTFHYQINLPGAAQQDCYTGISNGGYSIVVEASRAG